jgi:hypothetical protein
MLTPTWQHVTLAKVDAKPPGIWNVIREYVPGARLLRLQVVSVDDKKQAVPTTWSPTPGKDITADGITITPARTGLLLNSALYGALIAKVGGSSAEVPDSMSAAGPYGGKKVVAVGSFCVVSIASTEGGPLFLTMNDSPDSFDSHSGPLWVQIDEFPM